MVLTMAFWKTHTVGLLGSKGYRVDVEVSLNRGLPSLQIIGLPSTSARETKQRVIAALKNNRITSKAVRTIINLAPADIRKTACSPDLAIIVGLLRESQIIRWNTDEYCFIGEVGLDGSVKANELTVALGLTAQRHHFKKIIVPTNAQFPTTMPNTLAVCHVRELFGDACTLPTISITPKKITQPDYIQLLEGQRIAFQALQIALAGQHHMLLVGPPGSGKTTVASFASALLPASLEKHNQHFQLQALQPYLAVTNQTVMVSPHTSTTQLFGGGPLLKPGAVTLAHNGALILDEITAFSKKNLNLLYQPLTQHNITISYRQQTCTYPCQTTALATCNPCPCGFRLNHSNPKQTCSCTPNQIAQYTDKLTGALKDRFSLHVHLATPASSVHAIEKINLTPIREAIHQAQQEQKDRYQNNYFNSQATLETLQTYGLYEKSAVSLLNKAKVSLKLSHRAYHQITAVSRTIADLEQSTNVAKQHVAQAMQFRTQL